jgi:hypothetical protein
MEFSFMDIDDLAGFKGRYLSLEERCSSNLFDSISLSMGQQSV